MSNCGKQAVIEWIDLLKGNIVDFTVRYDPEKSSNQEQVETIFKNKWVKSGKNQEIEYSDIGHIYKYFTSGGNVDKIKVKFHSHMLFEWERKH